MRFAAVSYQMSIYRNENFIYPDISLRRSRLLSCHCEAMTLPFMAVAISCTLLCHCEAMLFPFMAVAISAVRTGTNTPFLTFPKRQKT